MCCLRAPVSMSGFADPFRFRVEGAFGGELKLVISSCMSFCTSNPSDACAVSLVIFPVNTPFKRFAIWRRYFRRFFHIANRKAGREGIRPGLPFFAPNSNQKAISAMVCPLLAWGCSPVPARIPTSTPFPLSRSETPSIPGSPACWVTRRIPVLDNGDHTFPDYPH